MKPLYPRSTPECRLFPIFKRFHQRAAAYRRPRRECPVMAWYAYCIGEKQAFPELARHRKPVPLESTLGVSGNQVFLYPASSPPSYQDQITGCIVRSPLDRGRVRLRPLRGARLCAFRHLSSSWVSRSSRCAAVFCMTGSFVQSSITACRYSLP